MAGQNSELAPRLVNALYTEAMLLADEARTHFDRDRMNGALDPEIAIAFSCESLKVTTRLMHSIAWLLNQKAFLAGELSDEEAVSDSRLLGYAPASDSFMVDRFPAEARELIVASEDLYLRLQRLSNNMELVPQNIPVPHKMFEQIRRAF